MEFDQQVKDLISEARSCVKQLESLSGSEDDANRALWIVHGLQNSGAYSTLEKALKAKGHMKYKIFLHWDYFRKYLPREGEIQIEEGDEEKAIGKLLEKIFWSEQNEITKRDVPSASELDIIELENGRRFRIQDIGFNELCSKPEDKFCDICAKFYINREDVPKAVHFNAKNKFYKGRNKLCEKCFRDWGIK